MIKCSLQDNVIIEATEVKLVLFLITGPTDHDRMQAEPSVFFTKTVYVE